MAKVKAVLLKPLDGDEIGSEREFSQADFERLKARGAVRRAAKPRPVKAEKVASEPANKMAATPANKSAAVE